MRGSAFRGTRPLVRWRRSPWSIGWVASLQLACGGSLSSRSVPPSASAPVVERTEPEPSTAPAVAAGDVDSPARVVLVQNRTCVAHGTAREVVCWGAPLGLLGSDEHVVQHATALDGSEALSGSRQALCGLRDGHVTCLHRDSFTQETRPPRVVEDLQGASSIGVLEDEVCAVVNGRAFCHSLHDGANRDLGEADSVVALHDAGGSTGRAGRASLVIVRESSIDRAYAGRVIEQGPSDPSVRFVGSGGCTTDSAGSARCCVQTAAGEVCTDVSRGVPALAAAQVDEHAVVVHLDGSVSSVRLADPFADAMPEGSEAFVPAPVDPLAGVSVTDAIGLASGPRACILRRAGRMLWAGT